MTVIGFTAIGKGWDIMCDEGLEELRSGKRMQ